MRGLIGVVAVGQPLLDAPQAQPQRDREQEPQRRPVKVAPGLRSVGRIEAPRRRPDDGGDIASRRGGSGVPAVAVSIFIYEYPATV